MTFEPPTPTPIRLQIQRLLDGRRQLRDELALIESRAQKYAELNALAWVDWEHAAAQADHAQEAARSLGSQAMSARPLHGVFVTVKDLFNLDGAVTMAGTRAVLPDLGRQSEVVDRLQAAGAIVFAKTNMHEIALGATGENSWTGDVRNPYDPARQAGGSSSGSAVAVACGIGAASVGSDTGGSVRIPAAFCGLVGYKPTYGAIPLQGALGLSWTCDHAGPLTNSVDDAALMYEVLSRRSTRHGATSRRPRLGVPRKWLKGRLDSGVREAFDRLLADLASDIDLVDTDVQTMPLAWEHYTPVVRAEGAWIHRAALAAGGEGFSELVAAPLRAGTSISAAQYFDAMQGRKTFSDDLDRHLAAVDAMILPTSAVPPPLRGQQEAEVEGGRLSVREAVLGQTLPFSFAGVPTLSLPCGFHQGLPFGLQVVARRDGDAGLLALGRWLEARLLDVSAAPS
jgi:aspartyl-tRNA(Asn)/glutamyl-tRNA(Gln) amidotransferase subunit A